MPDNVVSLPLRGKTYLSGPNRTPDATATNSIAIEGIVKTFKDMSYTTTNGAQVKTPRSGGEVTCILVRNDSGQALLPGRVVIWKAGFVGKRVDGYTSADGLAASRLAIPAGVVDEFLPAAGVADDDYFWLVVRGPALVKKSLDANTLTQGEAVVAITGADSLGTTTGRIKSFLQTSNTTEMANQATNKIGIAMSTSATTGADVLTYVQLF